MPRLGLVTLATLCAGLGAWASVVTLRYFEFGARALEADAAARELAGATALLLVVLEMAAFALAALLPRERLRAQRWGLATLAAAVLAFECMTIVLVQHGITRAADVSAEARQQRVVELHASIAALRATAEELRSAAAASAQSRVLASRQSAAESLSAALETERLVERRTAELGELQAAQRPTVTQILGEHGALAYAVARGLLVSLGGLMLFGTAGALLRAACGGAGVPVSVAAGPMSAPAVHGVSGAAAVVSTATVPVRFGASFALAAAPLAACATVPMPSPLAGVSVGGTPGAAPMPPAPREAVAVVVSAGPATAVSAVPAAASAQKQHHQVNVTAGAAPKSNMVPVDERLERVRAGVIAGTVAPSIRGVQAAVRCGAPMVRRYLAALEAEGVLRRTGQGFVRAG